MKNFNIFKISSIILIFCLFNCCDDKDKDSPNKTNNIDDIIGTWDLIGITSVHGNETYHVPQEEIDEDPLSYIYYDDGTAESYYKEKFTNFDWTADEKKLYCYSNVGVVIASYTYTVNSENLDLTFPMGDHTVTHQFKRQPNGPTSITLKHLENMTFEQWELIFGEVLMTGPGTLTGMEVGPANSDWDGIEIIEEVFQAPDGDPCDLAALVGKPDGFFCSCDGDPCAETFTVGNKYFNTPPGFADAEHNVFWDIHKINSLTSSLLHFVNLSHCTVKCIQVYSFNEKIIGKFLVTYDLTRDDESGKTVVSVNKTPISN